MLGMMAAATQDLTVTSVRTERRALTRAHLEDDLDAATVRAILALDDGRAPERWRVDGVSYPLTYDGVKMTASIQDEDGKFDINNADANTLLPLFELAGVDSATATILADRIVEWRTPMTSDDAHTLHGGTDADYAAAGLAWRPRHNDFQSVSEVRLVLGITPTLYEKIRPALTVYSRDDSPDEDLAPPFVLKALYPGNSAQVSKILAAHAGPLTQSDLTSDDSDDDNNASGAYVTPDSDASGRSFEIDVVADYNGRHMVRRTVVLMTGDTANPYLVEHWE